MSGGPARVSASRDRDDLDSDAIPDASSSIAKSVWNVMVRTVERHETGYAFAR